MIERLQRIASVLARIEWLLLVLCLAFIGLFIYSLAQTGDTEAEALMMPAMVGFCWSALLICIARLFIRIPEQPGKQHGFWRRTVLRFQRSMAGLLAILVIALTLTVVVFSYQFLRLFFMA